MKNLLLLLFVTSLSLWAGTDAVTVYEMEDADWKALQAARATVVELEDKAKRAAGWRPSSISLFDCEERVTEARLDGRFVTVTKRTRNICSNAVVFEYDGTFLQEYDQTAPYTPEEFEYIKPLQPSPLNCVDVCEDSTTCDCVDLNDIVKYEPDEGDYTVMEDGVLMWSSDSRGPLQWIDSKGKVARVQFRLPPGWTGNGKETKP